MNIPPEPYRLSGAERVMTPALLIYPRLVDRNIEATLKMLNGDPNRWRPHIKTAKLAAILRRMISYGIVNFKCSTTLELLTACEAGASDVLLAFAVMGANARRTVEIAKEYSQVSVSVLIETAVQATPWQGTNVGLFIDINSGMNRTGINGERAAEIAGLARELGSQFRGLHFYDGHISAPDFEERKRQGHEGYRHLIDLVAAVESTGVHVGELITSGTPAAPVAMLYQGFKNASFVHRVSPGTVVYNDTSSLAQLPAEYGYVPAVAVLTTVVSRPMPTHVTCDAGHKSVSADAGVPTCAVVGRPDLKPLKPSEEHLPIESPDEASTPAVGDLLYLIPRHVCPTVNNFDEALMVVDGQISAVEEVSARGHESPLAAEYEFA